MVIGYVFGDGPLPDVDEWGVRCRMCNVKLVEGRGGGELCVRCVRCVRSHHFFTATVGDVSRREEGWVKYKIWI